tara:strand:- start:2343 stop:3371 length:1029 start_codon:yes stop_codon:yes gene_type:complete
MVTGKLFLHIGMHKTGSSSIQSSLNGFENESIRYAKLGFENHSIPIYTAFSKNFLNYHIWKRQGLSDESIIKKKEKLLRIIRKELRHLKNIIISGEDTSALEEKELTSLKKEIVDAGKEVSVIAYVRDPASFIKSEFSEMVKNGMNDLCILNYKDRFKKVFDVFGENSVDLRLFRSDSLKGGDVVKDFYDILKLPEAPNLPKKNTSLSAEAISMIYILNQIVSSTDPSKRVRKAKNKCLNLFREFFSDGQIINHEIFLCSSIKEGDIWMKKYVDIDITYSKYENYDQSFKSFQNYLNDLAEKASFELMDYSKKSLGLAFSGDIDAKKHILKIFLYFYGKTLF